MRLLEKYICDICNHEFGSQENCLKCEETHVLPKAKSSPKGIWNCKEKYPHKLEVTFEDGETIRYRR